MRTWTVTLVVLHYDRCLNVKGFASLIESIFIHYILLSFVSLFIQCLNKKLLFAWTLFEWNHFPHDFTSSINYQTLMAARENKQTFKCLHIKTYTDTYSSQLLYFHIIWFVHKLHSIPLLFFRLCAFLHVRYTYRPTHKHLHCNHHFA